MPDPTPEPLTLAALEQLLLCVEERPRRTSGAPGWMQRELLRVCRQAITQAKELERLRAERDNAVQRGGAALRKLDVLVDCYRNAIEERDEALDAAVEAE